MAFYTTDVKALQKIMIDKDIRSISELSQESGVNRNALSALFNGSKQPTADTMQKLVHCLGIEPSLAGEIFFVPDLHGTQENESRTD